MKIRVLAAALFAGNDPVAAIALAAECSRTTHQSPLILDACRVYSAMLVSAAAKRVQTEGIWGRAVRGTRHPVLEMRAPRAMRARTSSRSP